jgi:drug/metabolite transporter (DMT)-like permease
VKSHTTLAALSLEPPPRLERPPDRPLLGMAWYGASSLFFASMGACSKALRDYPVWEIMLARAAVILACCSCALYRDGARPAAPLARAARALRCARATADPVATTDLFRLRASQQVTDCSHGPLRRTAHACTVCARRERERACASAGGSPLGTRRGLLVLGGTIGYASISSYFFASQRLPLADATTLTFLAPLVAACLSPWVLGERPGVAVAVTIPACLSGVLLVTQPPFLFGGGGARLSGIGVTFGLLQPVFSASAKVQTPGCDARGAACRLWCVRALA